MNENGQLNRNGEVLNLHGRINFQTVNSLYKLLKHELVPGVTRIDCSKVQHCDSSAISLLLASLRLAQDHQIKLQIQGMNEQILSLARMYDVDSILLTQKDRLPAQPDKFAET